MERQMYYTNFTAFAHWFFLNKWQPMTDDDVEWLSKKKKPVKES